MIAYLSVFVCVCLSFQILKKSGPYPMIILPPNGGYWVDGMDHDCSFDNQGNPILPQPNWKCKFETGETAKCYRRFFVGRVRYKVLSS